MGVGYWWFARIVTNQNHGYGSGDRYWPKARRTSEKTVDKPGCLGQKTICLNNTYRKILKIYIVTSPVAGEAYGHYVQFQRVVIICH